MINLGIAERALELSLDYAKTRKQFGQPIGEFQLIQSKLADMYAAIETMRTFSYRTLAKPTTWKSAAAAAATSTSSRRRAFSMRRRAARA